MDKAFDNHVKGIFGQLEVRLPSMDDPQLRNVEIIMAKHGLYDAAFQQVIHICTASKLI